ncbi:GNAT family N-acetyltransferase [Fangia hongkongensis]|uniref:GNAT family N-acetyltransferase n=1 Tax=Fangia hongkongensis TaxID=270495 RepID=UPI000361A31A|nr:GNAT family N-acetyltransferase [Fangia hongkongensis]MBK2126338.1 GNAT family N-acetyltransferase [Fangia hongkongensis]
MTITALNKVHLPQMTQLFAEANFFSADLFFRFNQRFFGFWQEGKLVAVIGAELNGHHGVLRSLVVSKAHRGAGIAKALIKHIEAYLVQQGVHTLYAFTQYGANYLTACNYRQILAKHVPSEINLLEYRLSTAKANDVIMSKELPYIKKQRAQQPSNYQNRLNPIKLITVAA